MDRSRSAKFIVLDAANLGTSRLRAVLARYQGADMEVVEARDFAEARTIAGRPDSAPQAAFVTYDAGTDADGSALSVLVQLGTQLPIVFVTRDGDDLASRRLGRTATVAELQTVYGIGARKAEQLGEAFVDEIRSYVAQS